MPKVIENLKIEIINVAKEQMLTNGYQGVNIREIAKRCNIAAGTIYNYFTSKEMLVANVILEDWYLVIDSMKRRAAKINGMMELFEVMYQELYVFYQKYKNVWSSYGISDKATCQYQERHELLRGQLALILQEGLNQFTKEENPYMADFLADQLLMFASYENFEYDHLKSILERLF